MINCTTSHVRMVLLSTVMPLVLIASPGCRGAGDEEDRTEDAISEQNEPETTIVHISKEKLPDQELDFCETFSLVYEDLYPVLTVLPNATDEEIYIDDPLMEEGFELTDWGRGNWLRGPRFILWEYQKDNCSCSVYKWYHYHEEMEDGKYSLRVTEQMDCNVGSPVEQSRYYDNYIVSTERIGCGD